MIEIQAAIGVDEQFDVRPITPDLIRKLAIEAPPPRLVDPLATEDL